MIEVGDTVRVISPCHTQNMTGRVKELFRNYQGVLVTVCLDGLRLNQVYNIRSLEFIRREEREMVKVEYLEVTKPIRLIEVEDIESKNILAIQKSKGSIGKITIYTRNRQDSAIRINIADARKLIAELTNLTNQLSKGDKYRENNEG